MKLLKAIAKIVYNIFENLNVEKIAGDRQIKIDWILEAGCHNGDDTVKLVGYFDPIRYLAFEPDETARYQAEQLFARSSRLNQVELYSYGLSNLDSKMYLKYVAEGKGSGSTHFADTGEDVVEIKAFDEHFTVMEHRGLLWLDVEGHTRQALEGMALSLEKFVIARVEVQLHTRNKFFVQDFKEVVQSLRKVSLVPVYGPIYPGYFGDIIFIKLNLLTLKDRLRSRILWMLMKFLHLYLYPKLNLLPPVL